MAYHKEILGCMLGRDASSSRVSARVCARERQTETEKEKERDYTHDGKSISFSPFSSLVSFIGLFYRKRQRKREITHMIGRLFFPPFSS